MTVEIAGTYRGTGRWQDEDGQGHRYEISARIETTPEGLRLSFRHVFPEEAGQDDIAQALEFRADVPDAETTTLRATLPGLPEIRGFRGARTLLYAIPIPDNRVNATWSFDAEGATVSGASERNAAGRYIAWEERLLRS